MDLNLLALGQFTGTEAYHNIMGVNCTDGVAYIAQNWYSWVVADALVILKMKLKDKDFVSVKLKIFEDKKCVILYEDGNGNVLFKQNYEYTNCTQDVVLFYTDNVLMLAGEY